MDLIVALILSALFSYFCSRFIRKAPWAFYAGALVIDALVISNVFAGSFAAASRALFPYFQQGVLGFALLVVVMFVGALPDGKIARTLRPVRGELSIIACILIAGHVVHYANPMLFRVLSGSLGATAATFWGTVLSLVLVALFVVLTVTSFRFVRNAMSPKAWKRVQLLAYPFFILTFLHIFIMLAPSALYAGGKALVNIVVYAAILVAYAVARLYRAYVARADAAAGAASDASAAGAAGVADVA